MAADLRGTARTPSTGSFYKGSQMVLPWATLQPCTSTHPSGLYCMRKVKSIRSLWRPHSVPSMKDLLSAGASSGHGQMSLSQVAAGEVAVVAVAALLPAVHLLQSGLWSANTFSASGFAHALSQSVAAWGRGEQSRGRSKGQEGQQPKAASSNFTICPSCLQSVVWQPKPPRDVLYPALSPTSTGIPSENISVPKEPIPNPCPACAQCSPWVKPGRGLVILAQAGADPPILIHYQPCCRHLQTHRNQWDNEY